MGAIVDLTLRSVLVVHEQRGCRRCLSVIVRKVARPPPAVEAALHVPATARVRGTYFDRGHREPPPSTTFT